MPGGGPPAVEEGVVTWAGEPALKVTLECDGEATPRDGEEIVSRFLPAMEKSLSSVDCDDMAMHGFVAESVVVMGLFLRRFQSDQDESGVELCGKSRVIIRYRSIRWRSKCGGNNQRQISKMVVMDMEAG